MTYYRNRPNKANSHVAAYESLLDLFTVISFILMFAAFTYVARSAAVSNNSASVSTQDLIGGSGMPQELPRDVVLLIVSPGKGRDRFILKDGDSGAAYNWQVTADNIEEVLNDQSSILERAKFIKLFIDKQKELTNPSVVLLIQHWLPNHRHGNYQIIFGE